MTELLALAETVTVSRPIFTLSITREGRSVWANESNPLYKYRPNLTEGDVLSALIAKNYREQFHVIHGTFMIDKTQLAKRCMDDIRTHMSLFLEKNLGMRSPRQSKVYRWTYRNMPQTTELNDTLVMLYKYMRTFCDGSMYVPGSVINKDAHIKNTITILEALQEKYDK